MDKLLLALAFAIGLNWIVTLHKSYESADRLWQRLLVISISLAIGFGLGVIALWL